MKSQRKKVLRHAEVKMGRSSAEGCCHSSKRTNWRAAVRYKNNWKKKTWEDTREQTGRRSMRKRFHVRLSEGIWPKLTEKVLRWRNKRDRNWNEWRNTNLRNCCLFIQYNWGYKPFKPHWLRDASTGLTFNNCTLCPHCVYVFCIYRRTNSDLCHLQHKLIGFYNRDEKCLQRGTDWVFK